MRELIVRCKVENVNLIHVVIGVKITQEGILEEYLLLPFLWGMDQDLLKYKLSFWFILGCSFIAVAFLLSWSTHLDLLARMFVFKEDPADKFIVFHTCRFVWFVLSYGMMVFIDPDLDFVRSLSSIYFFTFTVYVVCVV